MLGGYQVELPGNELIARRGMSAPYKRKGTPWQFPRRRQKCIAFVFVVETGNRFEWTISRDGSPQAAAGAPGQESTMS